MYLQPHTSQPQAEHRVLAAPHVPAPAAPRLFAVVAEIAVRQLGRQQVGDGRLDVGGKPHVAGHARERRGRVHVLAPELGLPVDLFRPPAVGIGEVDAVRLHDMVLDAAAQAVAHIAVEADVLEVGQRIRRGQRAGGIDVPWGFFARKDFARKVIEFPEVAAAVSHGVRQIAECGPFGLHVQDASMAGTADADIAIVCEIKKTARAPDALGMCVARTCADEIANDTAVAHVDERRADTCAASRRNEARQGLFNFVGDDAFGPKTRDLHDGAERMRVVVLRMIP